MLLLGANHCSSFWNSYCSLRLPPSRSLPRLLTWQDSTSEEAPALRARLSSVRCAESRCSPLRCLSLDSAKGDQKEITAGQPCHSGPCPAPIARRCDGHTLLHDGPQCWLSRWLPRPDSEPLEPDGVLSEFDAAISPVQDTAPASTAAAATFLWRHADAARRPRWSYDALWLSATIVRYVVSPFLPPHSMMISPRTCHFPSRVDLLAPEIEDRKHCPPGAEDRAETVSCVQKRRVAFVPYPRAFSASGRISTTPGSFRALRFVDSVDNLLRGCRGGCPGVT